MTYNEFIQAVQDRIKDRFDSGGSTAICYLLDNEQFAAQQEAHRDRLKAAIDKVLGHSHAFLPDALAEQDADYAAMLGGGSPDRRMAVRLYWLESQKDPE